MARFTSYDGVEIDYEVRGEARPLRLPTLLVHGFASSRHANWELPGWFVSLERVGRQVVALDCRGHGRSEKPHALEAYAGDAMPRDVIALLDHLEIPKADLMGYSMGGRISATLLVEHGQRFASGVLAGVGASLLAVEAEAERSERIAAVLEMTQVADDAPAAGRAFRAFAEAQGGDLRALAACMRASRRALPAEVLGGIDTPTLVVAGRDDELIGNPQRLADAIPGAKLAIVEGRDHLSTVPSRAFKEEVLAFWGEDPAAAAPPKLRA